MRLAIRTYKRGVLQTIERIEVSPDDFANVMENLADKHAEAMIETPGHVEIEFLDEPNVNERFFRIGTDSSRMVKPVDLDDALKKWGGQEPPKS